MDLETAGADSDSQEDRSDGETPDLRMEGVHSAPPLPGPSSVSLEEAEPGSLPSGAGPVVPASSMTLADSDREHLAVQRTSPGEVPLTYSTARLRRERGDVELPAPPANIHVSTSGEVSGSVTGVNYDMSTHFNMDRVYLTGSAVQEITRQQRSGALPAIQLGSSSGNTEEGLGRHVMPGQHPATIAELGLVTDTEEETDSTFPSALLDCKIRALKEDFVETAFSQSLERRLLDQGVAVVVGPTGEGKSSNGVMLCDKIRAHGYLSIYLESLGEIDTESIAKCRRNLCVVIDNVFGTSILDTANLGKWSQVLSNLISVQTAGRQGGGQGTREEGGSHGKKSLLLLLLSRDNVFSEALKRSTKLPSVLKDQAWQVCMKSADSLQREEKRQLVRKYAGKVGKVFTEKEENAVISSKVPLGFPQVCRLFSELKTVYDKPVEFFSKPTALLLETLVDMMGKNAMVRAALALLLLQGGSLTLQSLQLPDKREACGIHTAVQAIKEELGDLGSEGKTFEELLKTFETMCGGLLTEERGRVSFSHDSVQDAVGVALAEYSLSFVAGHCSLAVLSQCILLDDSSRSFFCEIKNQSVLAVPRGQWPLFTKRLVSELEKGKLREVFSCGLLSHSGLCGELAIECLKSKSFADIVHGVDVDCGLSFAFWATMAPPNFLTRLLPKCQLKSCELWQGIIGCCVKCHTELLKQMLRNLPKKGVEDWSVSISCWFGKHLTEEGGKAQSQSRGRPCSSGCRWDNLPVGRHAISGTVAAEHGHVSVLKTLVELGMPADVREPQQCTPLMSACSGGQKEAVAFLIKSGKVDLTAADSRGSTPLHKLAEGGHGDLACWLIEEHMADQVLNECINKVNDELQTPLMLACQHAPKLAMLLLAKEADTKKKDVKGKLCLHYASETGDLVLLEKLLGLKTMNVNEVSHTGWSPLHFACSKPKNFKSVQALLKHGAEVKPRDQSSKDSPLHVAVRQGDLDTVEALVKGSSDVIPASEGAKATTPFLLACERGNVDVVRYLQRNKAVVSARDQNDSTALHFAVRGGSVGTVQYVMDNTGVKINATNKFGTTPLLMGCKTGKVEVVKYLKEKAADTAVVDVKGNTALHCAAWSGNVDTVQYVMDDLGVEVTCMNKFGQTPLLVACESGRVEVVKYLKEKTADNAVVDLNGNTALHWAAWSGNVDTVQFVTNDLGVEVNCMNKFGQTPLLRACLNGKVEVVKYLRERTADSAVVDVDGDVALHLAAMSGNVDTVWYVTNDLGLEVNCMNKFGQTPFLKACLSGKVEVVKYLKEKTADSAVVDVDGDTALHCAAYSGNVNTVQYVMDDLGVEVNCMNKFGQTPLLRACESGKVEVVKYLRERTADSAVVDVKGNTALHCAARSGNVETVQCVMDDLGVEINCMNELGETPLLVACENGKVEMVKYLKEKSADSAIVNMNGNTALHLAAMSGNVETVQYVMDDLGVEVNCMNKFGQTPLLIACLSGKVEMVKYLKEKTADCAVVDLNGNTALHWAAWSGNVKTVQYVMNDLGVEVNCMNKFGKTPLLMACLNGRVEVVKYLRERRANFAVVDSFGNTALHCAAWSGNVETVQHLEDTDVSVDMKNRHQQSPLCLAWQRGHEAVVQLLAEWERSLKH